MYQKILEEIKNKNIAILGFGKEGKSVYNFIRRHLNDQKITILDQNEKLLENNPNLKEDSNLIVIANPNYLDNLNSFDLIIKSPGIKLKDIDITSFENKITSQLELTLKYFKNNIIGITGTKGKSTTTSLIKEVLKDQGYDAYLLGNIGIPIFDYIENVNENTKLVIEMGAPQLEFIHHAPHISIILNLFEEHLDFFKSKEHYFKSKLKIFEYQNEFDYALYISANDTLKHYIDKSNFRSNLIDVNNELKIKDAYVIFKNKKIYNINDERNLLGNHNLQNIMFVLRLSELLNLNLDSTVKTINNFKALEHRMEKVCTINGVTYYNDSIATIPDATINCIESLKFVDTLIFGGMDRGIDYTKLVDYIKKSNLENLICMPQTGHKIGKLIDNKNVYMVDTLAEAVKLAKKVSKNICVMSPAAPSYNAFKNFEEKGRKYKELLNEKN